jgi:hypothetical protein
MVLLVHKVQPVPMELREKLVLKENQAHKVHQAITEQMVKPVQQVQKDHRENKVRKEFKESQV